MYDEAESLRRWSMLNEPRLDPDESDGVPGRSIRYRGGFYNFSGLAEYYGSQFTAWFLLLFVEEFSGNAVIGNQKRCAALRNFLIWLAKHSTENPVGTTSSVFAALSNGKAPSRQDLSDSANILRNSLINVADKTILTSDSQVYRNTLVESLSSALRRLSNTGIWPKIAPLKLVKIPVSDEVILSLGQLGRGKRRQKFEGRDAYRRSIDASRVRLAELRRVMESFLLEEFAKFQDGQRLLEMDDELSLEEISGAIQLNTSTFNNDRPIPFESYAAFPPDDPDRRLSNVLKYIRYCDDGAIYLHRNRKYNYTYDKIIAACGGPKYVSARLEGSKLALISALCIVLIDTGMNIQPCREMPSDPFYGKFTRGRVSVTTLKATKTRPNSKVILTAVPVDGAEALLDVPGFQLSTKQVIEMWKLMSDTMRQRAEKQGCDTHKYLWICSKGVGNSGRILPIKPAAIKTQWDVFRDIFRHNEVLGDLRFSLCNIRPTYLQIRQSKNVNDYLIVSKMASHSDPSITFGVYLNRSEYRSLLSSLIRKFQDQLESAILVTNPSRIAHLVVSAEEVVGRAVQAISSGLDEILLDPRAFEDTEKAGVSEMTIHSDESLDFLSFNPVPNDLVILCLLKMGLEMAEEKFLVQNPKRWVNIWMPGLALMVATISRLNSSRYSHVLHQAQVVASDGVATGELRMFVPW